MKKRNTWMMIVGICVAAFGFFALIGGSTGPGIAFMAIGGVFILLYFLIPKKEKAPKFAEFKVAGVSFSNDDGRERQEIIKEIRAGRQVQIALNPYEFKGKPAIAVFADDEQIGNVPADSVDEIQPALKSYTVTEYKVLGSGIEAPFGFLVKISY